VKGPIGPGRPEMPAGLAAWVVLCPHWKPVMSRLVIQSSPSPHRSPGLSHHTVRDLVTIFLRIVFVSGTAVIKLAVLRKYSSHPSVLVGYNLPGAAQVMDCLAVEIASEAVCVAVQSRGVGGGLCCSGEEKVKSAATIC
jgi:hypothetical protein